VKKLLVGVGIGLLIIVIGIYYGARAYQLLLQQNVSLQANVLDLQSQVDILTQTLASTSIQLSSTTQALVVAQNENAALEPQITGLAGTVTTLQTLASIDPQLLEKYSKVYFLNDNYVPASLSPIDHQYLYNSNATQLFLSGALPKLEALLAAASRAGVPLKTISGYRSFYEQGALKLDYTETYGSGANQFSADEGYSEHQLGTAVDFGLQGAQNLRAQFASSTGYAWLTNNAYQFGFVLSYPPHNVYYQFEPWHWRYVGVALATALHANNEYFYNMGQRDINQYLISFFN
jgi:LAS superfamily LD-carboxypeptidase LdcB